MIIHICDRCGKEQEFTNASFVTASPYCEACRQDWERTRCVIEGASSALMIVLQRRWNGKKWDGKEGSLAPIEHVVNFMLRK